MTVVAALLIDGHPVVIADMLITGEQGAMFEGVRLPSSGPVSNLPPSKNPPIELLQKIVVLAENCVVAFATTDVYLRCRVAINALRRYAAEGPLTIVGFNQFLLDRGPLFNHVALVGWLVEKSGNEKLIAHRINHRGIQIIDANLGEIDAAGTGVSHLQNAGIFAPTNDDRWAGYSFVRRIVAKAFSLCSNLMREEHASGDPIVKGASGGGYEIATYINGSFGRVAPVTFVVWDAEVFGSEIGLSPPLLVMKQSTAGPYVTVNSVRLDAENHPKQLFYKGLLIVAPPLYKVEPLSDFELPEAFDLHSDMTFHSIYVAKEGSSPCLLSFGTLGRGEGVLGIESVGDQPRFRRPLALMNLITSIIAQEFGLPRQDVTLKSLG